MKEDLYSQHFQDHFLSHALRDKDFLRDVEPDLEADYFASEHAQRIIRILKDFHKRTGSAPNLLAHDVIQEAAIKAGLGDDTVNAMKVYTDMLLGFELQNRAYLLERWTSFLKQRHLLNNVSKVLEATKQGDEETARKLLKETVQYQPKASRENWDAGLYDPDPIRRALRRAGQDTEKLWTMIPPLDSLGVCLGLGHVGLWVSQTTGVGKSTALRHCALASVFQGHKTLIFVVGEMSKDEYEDCLDQAVSGLCREELDLSDRLLKRIRNMLRFGGDLYIVSLPAMTHTVQDLQNMEVEIENTEGFVAKTIVVDYADNLVPPSKSESLYHDGLQIALGLEAWAQTGRKRFLWNAAQGKTSAAEAPIAGIQHIGGSRGKGEQAPLVLTINRSPEEAKNDKTTVFIAKSRFSQSNISTTFKTDFAKQRFYVRDPEEDV